MIPKAEQFLLNESVTYRLKPEDPIRINMSRDTGVAIAERTRLKMIEFAKIHVEAALKSAAEKAELLDYFSFPGGIDFSRKSIHKESILNSYNLEEIQ